MRVPAPLCTWPARPTLSSMTTNPLTSSQRSVDRVPTELFAATSIWVAAVGAGVVEAIVRIFMLPDPPTGPQVVVRSLVYAAIVGLVLLLPTGRHSVRWALAVLLGGIGTLSLVIEPAGWLLDGGDPLAFLAASDTPTVLVTALRVLHLACVAVAVVLMFRPRATAYVRACTAERRAVAQGLS